MATRRKLAGWSQEAFAERAGIGVSTLKDIERGVSGGSPKVRAALAKTLNCSVDELHGSIAITDPTIDESQIKTAVAEAIRELFPREFAEASKKDNVLSTIPEEVVKNWNQAGVVRQMLCLWLLTGKDQYRRHLDIHLQRRLEAILRLVDHKPKPSAKDR